MNEKPSAEWVVETPSATKEYVHLIAPAQLTQVEVLSSSLGVQALFCRAGNWSGNLILSLAPGSDLAFTRFESKDGFCKVAAKAVELKEYGLFSRACAVQDFACVCCHLPEHTDHARIVGFVFGLTADRIVCQVGLLRERQDPPWLRTATYANAAVCVICVLLLVAGFFRKPCTASTE